MSFIIRTARARAYVFRPIIHSIIYMHFVKPNDIYFHMVYVVYDIKTILVIFKSPEIKILKIKSWLSSERASYNLRLL